jgi:hypothetical protein
MLASGLKYELGALANKDFRYQTNYKAPPGYHVGAKNHMISASPLIQSLEIYPTCPRKLRHGDGKKLAAGGERDLSRKTRPFRGRGFRLLRPNAQPRKGVGFRDRSIRCPQGGCRDAPEAVHGRARSSGFGRRPRRVARVQLLYGVSRDCSSIHGSARMRGGEIPARAAGERPSHALRRHSHFI